MMQRLYEAWQTRLFNKAEATIEKAREKERLALNKIHTISRDKLTLTWADLGLKVVKTWKESAHDVLVSLKLARPVKTNRVPWVIGDPDTNTKPIRKNIVTQRSTTDPEGNPTTVFYD